MSDETCRHGVMSDDQCDQCDAEIDDMEIEKQRDELMADGPGCWACNGSQEGQTDGSRCPECTPRKKRNCDEQ